MKKGWSSGKVAAVILGSIGAAIVLVISLFVSVYQLSEYIIAWDEYETEAREQERDRKKSEDKSEEWSWKEDGEESEEDFEDDSKDEDDFDYDYSEYYEFHDETRDDLSYQVSIEDFYMEADNGLNAQGMGAYPVITGENVKNSEIINNALKKEMSEIEKHVNEVSENIDKSESYLYKAECYVTYMDEDIFSIAYLEYGYLDGKRAESNVVSVNIDMDNGMVMTNTQLLEIDDEFSIEFRKRSDKQNGENELLDYYSDQDFTEMMNDEESLIIFYTPLGMEVGLNHDFGWVTVTYPDYKKYQNPL